MISIDSLHISLNQMLFLVVGIWPYEQSKLVQFQLILFFTILISSIIFQFTAFLTLKCTADLLIKVLSSALFYIFLVIKYISFHINIEVVKCLLEQLQNIYNELTDENEIDIIRKYRNYAQRYTVGLILFSIFLAPVPILYLVWPYFFDVSLSINESRRPLLKRIIVTEYFVDQKKYYYLILLHIISAMLIGIVVLLATGTILVVYLQYACGMFRIACYRIEQSMAVDALRKGSLRNKNFTYKKLICAVDMHRKAMRFSDSSISRFKVMFSVLIVVGTCSMALNIFRIFQGLSLGDIEDIVFPLIYAVIYLLYALLTNYHGQEVIDHNNAVFASAYNIQWYVASLNVQKMILFLFQRNTKSFNINIAGLFVGSLESAATWSPKNTPETYGTRNKLIYL
ncbi:uncharacterized protein [Anoplolepis gracilipes]|uniref:uncharacterized protein isoform X2 n=1 Tax=Anoplolepis gracilipes TaxID=354296 RepID=UPI003B9F1C4D